MDLDHLLSCALQLLHTLTELLQDLNSEIGNGYKVVLEHNGLTHKQKLLPAWTFTKINKISIAIKYKLGVSDQVPGIKTKCFFLNL